jgi:hypothetical protein
MPHAQRTKDFVTDVARAVGPAPLVQRGVFDYTSLYYLKRRIPSVERDRLVRTLEEGGFALVSHEELGALPEALRGQVAVVGSDRLLLGHARR